MIDTHTHLYAEQFDTDRDGVIAAAMQQGVCQFILPNIDRASFGSMMQLCSRYPSVCFPTLGLHPTSVGATVQDELAFVEEQISLHDFKAVGEIGIDCYWSLEYLEEQRHAFEMQVGLAAKRQLPIIIHARESFQEIFALLDRLHTGNCKGVFHSFTGTVDDYNKIRQYGTFKIGIGGVLTFKKSPLPEVVKHIPLTDIVLETDSPYLAPHPFRGKRNESAYLPLIAQKIAEIKGITLEEVDAVTTSNAKELFKI